MKLEEFVKILESTGFPVAFYEFPKEEPHDPPFICYLTLGQENFSADGIVYHSGTNVQVEVYTLQKDPVVEHVVENVLSAFYYSKNEGFIEKEKIYLVTYQLLL